MNRILSKPQDLLFHESQSNQNRLNKSFKSFTILGTI